MIGVTGTPGNVRSGGVWGVGLNADAIGNLPINGGYEAQAAQRFVAEHTGYVEAFRTWFKNDTGGYGAGTGGTIYVEIQTDSAGMPSGTQVGTGTYTATGTGEIPIGTQSPDNRFDLRTFTTPILLTAGVAYHMVYENIAADPVANFLSINCLYMGTTASPVQPRFGDEAYCTRKATTTGGAWVTAYGDSHTPMLELTYADGRVLGIGYMNTAAAYAADSLISGVTTMVRTAFTVPEPRLVFGAAVRVARNSGTIGGLVVRLEDDVVGYLDHFVDYGAFEEVASNVSTNAGDWVSGTFGVAGPWVLLPGVEYYLRLSSSGDSVFSTRALQAGTIYGFEADFGVGQLEESTDSGANWATHTNLTTYADLQFYLT